MKRLACFGEEVEERPFDQMTLRRNQREVWDGVLSEEECVRERRPRERSLLRVELYISSRILGSPHVVQPIG